MSDTGAPWNLPYPLASDLVRDGAADIEALAEATATGLSAAGNAGIGSNVVSVSKLDAFSTTSLTGEDITGLAATITPSSDTSKILVIVNVPAYSVSAGAVLLRLFRGSTAILDSTGASTANGSIASATFRMTNNSEVLISFAFHTLDSPGTDSPVTYKVQAAQTGGAATHVNQSPGGQFGGTSSITVIEVAV